MDVLKFEGDELVESVIQVGSDVLREQFWKSFGGDQTRVACSRFIEDVSQGRFPLPSELVDRWLNALSKDCLSSADVNVQQSAVPAVAGLICEQFLHLSSD